MAQARAELLGALQAEGKTLLRWMFGFWITAVTTLGGRAQGGRKREQLFQTVGACDEDDHGEPGSPDLLLKLEILVHGSETGEPVRDHEVKEFAVPFASTSRYQ